MLFSDDMDAASDDLAKIRWLRNLIRGVSEPELKKNASKRPCDCSEANKIQVKKLRSEKLPVRLSPSDYVIRWV